MRAIDLVQATIKKESAQQAAEAKLFSETKGADGTRYKQTQDAEARLYSDTKSAEGLLYKQRQDAEAACKSTCFKLLADSVARPLRYSRAASFHSSA
jgi:hypothetical protein